MKAALYARVSTDAQADEGFSIPAQINALKEYCQRNNIEIYHIYSDEGVSAKFTDESKRPQFNQMIKDAQNQCFQIILCHKYDRFARNVELSQRVKRQLKDTGISVLSITEPVENSPIGFVTEGLMDLLAEYYVRNLAQESKKGHVQRAKQGLHNGSIPYGYQKDNDHPSGISINNEQADIVRIIFDKYINAGWGSVKIAIWLNDNGIPGACMGNWAHYTVNRILKNVKYVGRIFYDGQIYEGLHEPIILVETFELAQRYMIDRTWKREYRGVNYEKFAMLGLLRCGLCKKVFSIQRVMCKPGRKETCCYYYKCNNRKHADARYPCSHKETYNVYKLEARVLDQIKFLLKNKEIPLDIKPKVNLFEVLNVQKGKLEAEIDRAKRAFLAGVFTLEEYTQEKNRIQNDLDSIANTKTDVDQHEYRNKMKNALEEYEQAQTPAGKRNALKRIVKNIYIYPDGIEFELVD